MAAKKAAVQPPSLRLDDQLCFALYAASRKVTAAYQPLLDAIDLTYPQYLVMLVLWEQEAGASCSVGELGQRLALDSGTLTPLLKRLEAKGLVTRTRLATDERVVQIGLTDAGHALQSKAAQVPAALMCRFDGDVNELVRLREQLKALIRLFG